MEDKYKSQDVELLGMFNVTIIFKWATLIHVFVLLSTGAEIAVPLSRNYTLFFFAVLLAAIITFFREKIFYWCSTNGVYLCAFLTILLLSDFLLMTYGGGWRSSWYIYTFYTPLATAVFGSTMVTFFVSAILSVLYGTSIILNGYSFKMIMERDILDQIISNCFSYLFAGGIFSYSAVIVRRLHKTNTELKEKTEQLGEAQELLDHLKKHSKNLTEAIKETLNTRGLLDSLPSEIKEREDVEHDKSLSEREKEILILIVDGYTTSEISSRLNLSFHTVETHRKSIYKKLDVNNSAQAIIKAIRENIVSR